MKKEKLPDKKGPASLSPGMEALIKEAEENATSWRAEPDPFLQRLRLLTSDQQEALFLALLTKEGGVALVGAIMGKEEKVDLALARTLGRWVSPQAPPLLHQLAGLSSSKAVLKAIRKSIFQLKSQGLEVKEVGDQSPAVYRPLQPASPEGFLSSIDSTGTRLVWFLRPQPLQGAFAFQAVVSDLKGIVDFTGFETSRKKFHEYLGEFRKEAPWEIVEGDPEYCHGLIAEAAEVNQREGQPAPEAFLKWRTLMGNPPELPLKPLIYLYLKEEEWKGRTELVDRSATLFQIPLFHDWFLAEEEIKKYIPLLKEASESRLVLTPYQREARVIDIHRQAVEELFDKPRRVLFRRRLEEMAYFLWRKTARQNEAQATLAAALAMEAEGGMFYTHPFLREMVKRSLDAQVQAEAQQKEAQKADLLIKP